MRFRSYTLVALLAGLASAGGLAFPGGLASPGGLGSPGGLVAAGGLGSPGGLALVGGLASPGGLAPVGGRPWAAGPPISADATTVPPVLVARYGFDTGAGVIADVSGRGHTLTIVAGHGGSVRPIAHGSGRALAFPAKCAKPARPAKACPHVVLQTPGTADLNPGIKPIAYGASVRLAQSQTTKGQNVVQKGYSVTTSQYKLQIDGHAGRPSCVLVDVAKRGIRLIRSVVSVADGTWHSIECRRVGPSFTIAVDGVIRGAGIVPATLSVSNPDPLSVGGKGASRNNDQFQGALDNVWVSIG
jgi:hypothetical protein